MNNYNNILIKSCPPISVADFSKKEIIAFIREKLIHRNIDSCYLFGSVANGKANPWSDIDILIVTESTKPFIERPLDFQELYDLEVAVDIIVYTHAEFEKIKESKSGFAIDIQKRMIKII